MKSLRAAINAMCSQCLYDEAGPGTKAVQIALCTSRDCPLYEVRPLTATVIPQSVLEQMHITQDQIDPRVKSLVKGKAK